MAKNKGYKIKRYNKIYRRNRSSNMGPMGFIVIIAVVLILLCVGWSIYDPVYNFLTGKIETPQISSSSSTPDESTSEGDTQGDTNGDNQDDTQDTSSEEEEVQQAENSKAALISFDIASDTAKLSEYIAQIKEQGYNSAVVEIKDVDGQVLYKTENQTITSLNTVSSSAFDLQAVCKALSDEGITPIVKIQTFRDNAAASAMKDAAVRYKPDTSYLWADDAPANGGKYWLNPNSEKAQEYIFAIIDDAVSMGAEKVILDTVQFPEGYSLDLCDFGDMESKQAVIENFIAAAQQKAQAKNPEAEVYFEINVNGSYMEDNDQYGVSPFKIAAQNVVLDFADTSFKYGDINISDFNTDTAQRVSSALGEINKISAERTKTMLLLPEEGISSAELDSVIESIAGQNAQSTEIFTQSQS